MIALRDKSKCTGCTACAEICPLNCVAMVPDEDGFLYPEIDRDMCAGCGRCETVCPVEDPVPRANTVEQSYGLRAKDLDLRLNSSSGGAFSLLAETVLAQGGAVFGAAMAPDCKSVRHVMAENMEELAPLRGSKYLQSELGDTFRRVKAELVRRPVLFSGTPCQVDGLNAYLGRGYENLLTVEVICHGAPTPKLWEKYIKDIEQRSGSQAERVNFRDKRYGWSSYMLCVKAGGREYGQKIDDYMRMFLRDLCLRPSCYQCPSKGLERSADLTIADFWGIGNVVPELDDDKGTSLVLVHTEKGQAALEAILPKTAWKQVDTTAALAGNPAMLRSVQKPAVRERFMEDMDKLPFQALAGKYVPLSARERQLALIQKLGLLPLARRLLGRK